MITEDTTQVNDVESASNQSRCLSCGEQCRERFKITLRQPLRGNAYGRIIDTGSVCEQCGEQLRFNARTEGDQ